MGISTNQTPAPKGTGRLPLKTALHVTAAMAAAGLVASCASAPTKTRHGKEYFSESTYGVPASPRVVEYGQPVPQGGGRYMVGKAYTVKGRVYTPSEDASYTAVGYASWYGSAFHGRRTANGEVYDMDSLSAAAPTMPLPSYARVTNLQNGRSIVVRVNDRGPYERNRIIDLSSMTADLLDLKRHGTAKVKVAYVGPARMEGGDKRMLLASYRGPSNIGDTMFAMKAPASTPDTVMAMAAPPPVNSGMVMAMAPIPRARPDVTNYGGAIDPYGYEQAASRQNAPAIVQPEVEQANVAGGLAPAAHSLGSFTVQQPIGYNSAPVLPAASSSDDYYVPDLTPASSRSSYAKDAVRTPAEIAINEFAKPSSKDEDLQAALSQAIDRAASERSANLPEVQVGVFSDTANADTIANRLSQLGTIRRSDVLVGGKPMHSLRLLVRNAKLSSPEIVAAVQAAGAPGAYVISR